MRSEGNIRHGKTHLLKTKDAGHALEFFRSLTENKRGLCITNENPRELKKRYDLLGIDFARLSDNHDKSAIDYDELDLLGLIIKRFISEEDGVVLIHGIHLLLENNSPETMIRFFRSIDDQINQHHSTLLIVLDESELRREQLRLLEKELDFNIKRIGPSSKKIREKTFSGDKDLVSEVREMMDFLKDQEINLEKELHDKRYPDQFKREDADLEKIHDSIEDLRRENEELKKQLQNLKGQKEVIDHGDRRKKIEGDVISTIDEEKEDIKKQMKKMENEKKVDEFSDKSSDDLLETLSDLKDEVKSLRDEVTEIRDDETQTISDLPESKKPTQFDKSHDDRKVIEEPKFKDVDEDVQPSKKEEKPTKSDQDLEEEMKGYGVDIKPGSVIDRDLFSETDLRIGSDSTVKGSLEADGDVIIEEEVIIQGYATSNQGDVDIGPDSKVEGDVKGNSVALSERSRVKDIRAEDKVVLKRGSSVENVYCEKDIDISENVNIVGDIYYGGDLELKKSDITITKKIHPVKNLEKIKEDGKGEEDGEEEILDERWASE